MAISTVVNTIRRNGKIIKQELNLIPEGNTILSYSSTNGDIFSIVKEGDKFKLKFSQHGKELLGLTSDVDVQLSDKSASMLPKKSGKVVTVGQEMELTVKINGKAGKLVANAEKVSFSQGSEKHEYKVKDDNTLSLNLSQEGVGLVMGESSLFSSAPKAYDQEFPLPIFKLLVASKQENRPSTTKVGNFTLKVFPSNRSKPNYVLINNTTQTPYILHGNTFHKFNGFVPLKDDKDKYYLALRTSGNGDLHFDLPTESGSFTEASMEMIKFVQADNAITENLSSPSKATLNVPGVSLKFENEDSANIRQIKPAFRGAEYDLGFTPTSPSVDPSNENDIALQLATSEASDKFAGEELSDSISRASLHFNLWSDRPSTSTEAKDNLSNILSSAIEIEKSIKNYQGKMEGYEAIPFSLDQKVQEINRLNQSLSESKADPTLVHFAKKFVSNVNDKAKDVFAENEKQQEKETKEREFYSNPILQAASNSKFSINEFIANSTSLDDALQNHLNNYLTTLDKITKAFKSLVLDGAEAQPLIQTINENMEKLDYTFEELKSAELDPALLEKLKNNKKKFSEKLNAKLDEYKEDENEATSATTNEDEDGAEAVNEEEKIEKEPEEKSYKTQIENWTKITFPLGGLLFLAGCVIPGIGILLVGLGTAVMGTSVILNANADKFKFKQAFGKAEKIISQAEKESLEDAMEVASFMENEQTLENLQEAVASISQKFENIMQNENLPTHVLTEIYDRCGIGFNATDSADSRSKQLSGIEGHEIRTNMYGLMSAIQNAPESEKQAHIDRFISQKFSDDITQDEKEQLTKLFTSEESSSALNSLSVSMKDLNDEEAIMLKLLTSQKVALGSMRDSLIEKVVSSERFAGKLDKLLDRYGSTIYRHYALDKNLSQAKLNAIFAKLPEADKEACLTQMEAIGDKMLADMAEVEKLAQSSKEKFDRIAFVQNYINAMQNLQTSPEVATISQVGSDAKTYLDLQAYRTNNNKIAGINSTLDRMRNLGIEKLTKVVDTITTIPASTTKRMEELKSRYALILQEARASGVYDVIAKQMASELPTVQLTTDKIDEDEIKLISDIVKADSSNPNYAKLKDALKRLDSGKVEEDLSQNLFSKYYKALGIPSKEVQIFSAEIDQQWQKLVNERKEHRKNNTQYTDAYRFLSDADMKKALICKQYIHRQIQIAGNEDVKNQFKQLDKLLNMTINGQLANYHMTMAENNALGLTILDYDAQLEDSLYNLTDSIDGLQTLTSILNTFPANEREALQKAIALKLAGEGKANFDANKAVREVLSDRYGAFQIQHNMPSANQIIDNCIKTNLTALLKHFPESDRAELESKIQAVLTTNVLDKEEEIRGILFDKYQTSLLSIDSQLDQFVATPDMIVSQWIKESSSSSLSEARASIDRQARQELSCVAGNLGENYSTMLYEDLLRGTKMDAKEDYELTPGQKNQEEHLNKQMISMQETEKAFTLAWAKARTTGDFTALQKLFEKPSAKAPEAEKLAYNSVMTNLKEFGINVEQVEDILKTLKTETYNAGTDTAKLAKAIKASQLRCVITESRGKYSKLGREAIAEKKAELANLQKMNRTLTDHDREAIATESRAQRAISDAEIFADKYNAILSLSKPPVSLSLQQIKNIISNFSHGKFSNPENIPEELKGLRFTEKDIRIMEKLGFEADTLPSMTKEEVIEKIKKYVEAECKPFEEIQSKGRDQRKDERSADLEKTDKPKQVRNKISLIRRIFGNVKLKDQLTKEQEELEKELYGKLELDKVAQSEINTALDPAKDSERSA